MTMELLDLGSSHDRLRLSFREKVISRRSIVAPSRKRRKPFKGYFLYEVDGAREDPILDKADTMEELMELNKAIANAPRGLSMLGQSGYISDSSWLLTSTPYSVSREDSQWSEMEDDVNHFPIQDDDDYEDVGQEEQFSRDAIKDLASGAKNVATEAFTQDAVDDVWKHLTALKTERGAGARRSIIAPRTSVVSARSRGLSQPPLPPENIRDASRSRSRTLGAPPMIPRKNSGLGAMMFGDGDDDDHDDHDDHGSNISLLELDSDVDQHKQDVLRAATKHLDRAQERDFHLDQEDDEDVSARPSKSRDSDGPDHTSLLPRDVTKRKERIMHRRQKTDGKLKWADQVETSDSEPQKPKKKTAEDKHLDEISKDKEHARNLLDNIGQGRRPRPARSPRLASPGPMTPGRGRGTSIVVTPVADEKGNEDETVAVLPPLDPSVNLDPSISFRHQRIQSTMLEISVDQTDSKRRLRTLLYEAQLSRRRQRKTLERLLNRVQAEGFKYLEARRTIVALNDNRETTIEQKHKQEERDRDARIYMKQLQDGRFMHNPRRRVPPTMQVRDEKPSELAKTSFVQRIKNPSVQGKNALPVDMPIRMWNEPNDEYGQKLYRAFHQKALKAQALEKRSIKFQNKLEAAQQGRDQILAQIKDFRADIAARSNKGDITDDWLLDKRADELEDVLKPYTEKVRAIVQRIDNHKKLVAQLNRLVKKTRSAVEQNIPHRMVRLYAWLQDLDKSVEHHLKYKIKFKTRGTAYKVALADGMNMLHASCGFDNKTKMIDQALLTSVIGKGNFLTSRRDVTGRRSGSAVQKSFLGEEDLKLVISLDEQLRGLSLKTRKKIRRQIVRDVFMRHNMFERVRRFHAEETQAKRLEKDRGGRRSLPHDLIEIEMSDEENIDSDGENDMRHSFTVPHIITPRR